MVSKLICFFGVAIMSYCLWKMLPDETGQNMKISLIILFAFSLLMSMLFYYRLDSRIEIIAGLISGIVITAIEFGLMKYITF